MGPLGCIGYMRGIYLLRAILRDHVTTPRNKLDLLELRVVRV